VNINCGGISSSSSQQQQQQQANGGAAGGSQSSSSNASTAAAAAVASAEIGTTKNRSHSTTSLGYHYHGHPNGKKLMRERKTVCSLHPMTNNEFAHLEALNNSCCALAAAVSTGGENNADSTTESALNSCAGSGGGSGSGLHLRSDDCWDNEDASQCSSFPASAGDSRRGSAISSTRYEVKVL